ncbi:MULTISPECIES: 4'-phosphopantetheinyl transferase family protein [unclassified Moraxella]|uniref:4'-phosphopantetheinyl transferase family protein n=1 Tax=unclassified Moraxella TaxID=2685852 RepID=UPI00359D7221
MIYLHHQILVNGVNNQGIRQTMPSKADLRQSRHQILSQFCGRHGLPTPNYDKQINGKPIITNNHLVFNQSHHDTAYVLAWSLSVAELGVDVESVCRQANFEQLARRYFHADEYRYWQENDCDVRLWFRLWTIKEAVIKANGIGIRLALRELNAKFINRHQGEIFHDKMGCYRFECIDMGDDVITIAYTGDVWQAWTLK